MTENDYQAEFNALFGKRTKKEPTSEVITPFDLPAVSCTHWQSIEEAIAETSDDGLCHGDAVLAAETNHALLAALRPKALRVLGEVMDIPTPYPDDENYARIISAKKDAAVNTMTISLKADENCLRQRHSDVLGRLAQSVEAELARRARALTATVIEVVPSQG
jgi:hypothetical protein